MTYLAELLRVLAEVDRWTSRIGSDVAPPGPQSGSALIGDDRHMHPHQLSHAAWSSLSHAVDHLHCLRSLLQDAHVIHMFAPYSLVRGALENASAAVWMLHPSSRIERVGRRLRLATTDIRHSEAAKQLVGQVGPRSKDERMAEVKEA